MRITRLELENFRCFRHLILDGIPQQAVLVSRNGVGKSSILEALAFAREFVATYNPNGSFFRSGARRWPSHIRNPVRVGAGHCTITVTVEATGRERIAFGSASSLQGTAHVSISTSGELVGLSCDAVAQELFQFHSPEEGIGYFDYYRPIRLYPQTGATLGLQPIALNDIRETFDEVGRQFNEHNKFHEFRQFLVNQTFEDFAAYREEQRDPDSLKPLREAVNTLLSPKEFIGFKSAKDNRPLITMSTPWGEHDVDLLSDGERELFYILGRLFRYRQLANVVLWDTPESHLNGTVQSQLLAVALRLAPASQFWIATHGIEIIDSVTEDSLFILQPNGTDIELVRGGAPATKARSRAYAELGARVALQAVSRLNMFVEGRGTASDKRLYDRLLGYRCPGVNIVAGGNKDTILVTGSRAHDLLSQVISNADFLALVDRDYLTLEQAMGIEKQYAGRVLVLRVHELENIFLDSDLLWNTMQVLGKLDVFPSKQDMDQALLGAATSLREWIAVDWICWELDKERRNFRRRVNMQSPRESLKSFVKDYQTGTAKLSDSKTIGALMDERLAQIDKALADGSWKTILPGKEVLDAFLGNTIRISRTDLLDAVSATIIRERIRVEEVERIVEVLQGKLGVAAS